MFLFPFLSCFNSSLTNYCGFVDFSNLIGSAKQETYSTDFISYTATENCFVIVNQNATSNMESFIKINNVLVGRDYDQTEHTRAKISTYYLKKGQTISANSYVIISVFSLLN